MPLYFFTVLLLISYIFVYLVFRKDVFARQSYVVMFSQITCTESLLLNTLQSPEHLDTNS